MSSSPPLKKKDNDKQKKKKSTINDTDFRRYIHKVFRQVFPEKPKNGKAKFTISKRGMNVVNDFMIDVFQRLARESSGLAKMDRGRRNSKNPLTILNSRHIQTATRFVIPGELSKNAVFEGTKAVQKYYSE